MWVAICVGDVRDLLCGQVDLERLVGDQRRSSGIDVPPLDRAHQRVAVGVKLERGGAFVVDLLAGRKRGHGRRPAGRPGGDRCARSVGDVTQRVADRRAVVAVCLLSGESDQVDGVVGFLDVGLWRQLAVLGLVGRLERGRGGRGERRGRCPALRQSWRSQCGEHARVLGAVDEEVVLEHVAFLGLAQEGRRRSRVGDRRQGVGAGALLQLGSVGRLVLFVRDLVRDRPARGRERRRKRVAQALAVSVVHVQRADRRNVLVLRQVGQNDALRRV